MTTYVIFWDPGTAIKAKLVDLWKWPFIQRSPFQHISSTLKQHLNENIGSWRKSFPFLLPLSWPSYIFVERLWPSRIASPTSRASSHVMACRVSDSSRSNRWAPLVKRGWKRRWHILFTLDSQRAHGHSFKPFPIQLYWNISSLELTKFIMRLNELFLFFAISDWFSSNRPLDALQNTGRTHYFRLTNSK